MDCSVDGCIRHVFARGLCHPHYDADRKANAPCCTSDECEKPQHAAGLCDRHYRAAKAATAAKCAVDGCGRAVVAGGLCDSHRKRKDRHGHLDTQRPQDWGARRGHPLYESWNWQRRGRMLASEWRDDFWAFIRDVGVRPSPTHQLRRARDAEPIGPQNFEWRERIIAVPATANRAEYNRVYQRERYAKSIEKGRKDKFARQYGITPDDYGAMLSSQRGVCAICSRPETSLNQHTHEPRRLAVDHCHNSKKIRGLLCKSCNTAIGAFDEDPARMKAAIRYLAKHRE